MNKVVSIQIGGITIANSLLDACLRYIHDNPPRSKISFIIRDNNGELKSLTIRDMDKGTVAYGNFDGIQDFLEFAQEEVGGSK